MGADAGQIDALDLSLFGNVRVDYFDDGKQITVSGFRLEPFKDHFQTLGFKRCANGWIADIDQDDPEKIKDNLMEKVVSSVSGSHAGGGRFGNFKPLPPTTGVFPSRVERGPSEAPPRPHFPAGVSAAAGSTKYQIEQQQTGGD